MEKLAKEYYDISLDILKNLEKENLEQVDSLLDKRQFILDNIIDVEKFKKTAAQYDILKIDNQIKVVLYEKIKVVKHEIKEHNISKRANISYGISRNKKLNIFNEKA